MSDLPMIYDPSLLSKLESYEDYLSFYIQLDEAATGFSWMKADLLLQMVEKLGEGSIEELSKDLRQPRSTIINYTRVSRAFPPDKRDPGASFSAHFQASFADSFDEKTKQFKSDKRFDWVEKSVDEGLSTRQLAAKIQEEKEETMSLDELPAAELREAEQLVASIQNRLDRLLVNLKHGNTSALEKIKRLYAQIFS